MIPISPYDIVANEYYDHNLHPTCANFRELSKKLIKEVLSKFGTEDEIVEVGAGKSMVTEILLERNETTFSHISLVDSSSRMLMYSLNSEALGARLIVGDAVALPASADSIDLVVSSLGDPYNTPSYWKEVTRILKKKGFCIFTTPSFEWASRFRKVDELNVSEFEIGNEIISLPSFILDYQQQLKMFCNENLQLIKSASATITSVTDSKISPKISGVLTDSSLPVITLYLVQKE